jgi:hypothetical protein
MEYRSDRLIAGRLLTYQVDAKAKDLHPAYRPWLGPAVEIGLRPEYSRFQCRTCGRVDQLACFRHGLPGDFVVPKPRPDLHVTDEYIYVWSRRLTNHIRRVARAHLEFFDLPGDHGYVVPWPKRIFRVPKGSRILGDMDKHPPGIAFQPRSKPCPRCRRYRSTTFWSQYFEVPDDVVIAGAPIDTADYPAMFHLMTWIAGKTLAEHIGKRKFSNLVLKNTFANE